MSEKYTIEMFERAGPELRDQARHHCGLDRDRVAREAQRPHSGGAVSRETLRIDSG